MEQREQLTEDFKVRYTDINLLLALKDAAITRNIDWADAESIERVGGDSSTSQVKTRHMRLSSCRQFDISTIS